MIYFGLRSSKHYLKLLEKVRTEASAHDLCSVIGGLAFLHALGRGAKSLTLVDTDYDALPHCKLILKLIELAPSLSQFLSYLSGREVSMLSSDGAKFGPLVSHTDYFDKKLDPEEFQLYQNTYARISFNESSGTFIIDNNTVKFFGFDLTPMTFCWHFGAGNFRDEQSFLELKKVLSSLSICFIHGSLDTIDYGKLFPKNQLSLTLLVSNCDSPLFTKKDTILRRVLATAVKPVRYVSWLRDLTVAPMARDLQEDILSKLAPYTEKKTVFSLREFLPEFINQDSLRARALHLFSGFDDLTQNIIHGGQSFLYVHQDSNIANLKENIARLLEIIWPSMKSIIFVTPRSASATLELLEHSHFQESYELTSIEWAADSAIMIWGLRGGI